MPLADDVRVSVDPGGTVADKRGDVVVDVFGTATAPPTAAAPGAAAAEGFAER